MVRKEKEKREQNKSSTFIYNALSREQKKAKKNGKLGNYSYPSVLVYICTSLLQLTVEWRDLSQS
jgi:hypothetical protein